MLLRCEVRHHKALTDLTAIAKVPAMHVTTDLEIGHEADSPDHR
jgi:hypothetical protein